VRGKTNGNGYAFGWLAKRTTRHPRLLLSTVEYIIFILSWFVVPNIKHQSAGKNFSFGEHLLPKARECQRHLIKRL
jgi:hypothetical protein